MAPDATTAASGGSLLFEQYRHFSTLKPKNRKTRLRARWGGAGKKQARFYPDMMMVI
jgi:hypothetical protein